MLKFAKSIFYLQNLSNRIFIQNDKTLYEIFKPIKNKHFFRKNSQILENPKKKIFFLCNRLAHFLGYYESSEIMTGFSSYL